MLDLCAAPGGKTLQLAAAGWTVIALDVSGRRLERLRDNLRRTGLSAEVVQADALEWSRRRGSRSGRVAWHYVTELAGRAGKSL